MMSNFLFEPNPESPVGMPLTIWDPDTGQEIEAIVATDGFRVEVSAGDYDSLPGVSFYVPDEQRVVFGFLSGIADIASEDAGAIMAEEVVFPTLMSRYESPLSVINYKAELERALNTGKFIIDSQLDLTE